MTTTSVHGLARKDHKKGVFADGQSVAHRLGLSWRDLNETEAMRIVRDYRDAWWKADEAFWPAEAEATA